MNFLKNLFGGGGSGPNGGRYLTLYVQPKMCKEILEVRVDLHNSLSLTDDESGYFVRKVASGTRCPFSAELYLEFDKGRTLLNQSIENGRFVTEADYRAAQAGSATSAE